MEISVRRKNLGEISFLEVFQNYEGESERKKKPIVILCHGYTGMKEYLLPQAYLLSTNGFFVVVPDALNHGERRKGDVPEILSTVQQSVIEINLLIESYIDSSEADYTRVGLSGYSMGGMVTFAYLAFAENKIKAAVPIISTPDFMSVLNNLNLIEEIERLQSQGIMGTGSDFDGYKERVSQYNPIKHYEKMKDTPLLMLCGENDNITFPEGAEKIYGLLKPIVSDKEALKYISYPGVGHQDTFQMNYQMMTWMKKYL